MRMTSSLSSTVVAAGLLRRRGTPQAFRDLRGPSGCEHACRLRRRGQRLTEGLILSPIASSAPATRRAAASRPRLGASSVSARSAKIAPRVASTFARIRSRSTLQMHDHLAHRGNRRTRGLHGRGNGRRLGVPAANAALVLRQRAGQKRRRRAPAAASPLPARSRQPAGLRLCGMDDDPPPRSDASPTSGCISRTDVARDLAERRGVDAARRDERGEPIALRVPGRARD